MQRTIRLYAAATTFVLAALLLTGFQAGNNQRFTEITVERINVVDEDGQNRLVISNGSLMPGVIQRGELLTPNGGRTGMLFYNEEGTEAGGLIFSGSRTDGEVTAVGSLTFDQYEQDQTVALQYVDDNGTRRAGLTIVDRSPDVSTGELIERRQEIGRMEDGPEKTAAERRCCMDRIRPHMPSARSLFSFGSPQISVLRAQACG